MTIKKLISLFLIFFSISTKADTNDAEKFCRLFSAKFEELNKQLPISVDHMTKYIASNAYYFNGKCVIKNDYIIDEKKFIQKIKEEVLSTFEDESTLEEFAYEFPSLSEEEIEKVSNKQYLRFSEKFKTRSGVIDYINKEGRNELQNSFTKLQFNILKSLNENLLAMSNVKIKYIYNFDDVNIQPFITEF